MQDCICSSNKSLLFCRASSSVDTDYRRMCSKSLRSLGFQMSTSQSKYIYIYIYILYRCINVIKARSRTTHVDTGIDIGSTEKVRCGCRTVLYTLPMAMATKNGAYLLTSLSRFMLQIKKEILKNRTFFNYTIG